MELIYKSAVKAEIERRKQHLFDNIICERDKEWAVRTAHQLNRIISFLDTLEVKEVDLEKEIDDYINEHFSECEDGVLISDANSKELTLLDVMPMARHFYELGLKAQKL